MSCENVEENALEENLGSIPEFVWSNGGISQ
jgi:hypothetical protein